MKKLPLSHKGGRTRIKSGKVLDPKVASDPSAALNAFETGFPAGAERRDAAAAGIAGGAGGLGAIGGIGVEGGRGAESPRNAGQLQTEKEKRREDYLLTQGMIFALRNSLGRQDVVQNREKKLVTIEDFRLVEKRDYPPEGNTDSPGHNLNHTFKFKLYAPKIFRKIREHFGVDQMKFYTSIAGEYNYNVFQSNAKSGEELFSSHNERYMIKTMKAVEVKFLRKILPHYYKHVKSKSDTFLVRIYGMYRIKMRVRHSHLHNREVHFMVMNSVTGTNKEIHCKFDLKGSLSGRIAKEGESVKKDLDLDNSKRKIHLGPQRESFLKIIQLDADFLARMNIMDYSMLLGVHYRGKINITSPQAASSGGGIGVTKTNGSAEDVGRLPSGGGGQLANSEMKTEAENRHDRGRSNINGGGGSGRMNGNKDVAVSASNSAISGKEDSSEEEEDDDDEDDDDEEEEDDDDEVAEVAGQKTMVTIPPTAADRRRSRNKGRTTKKGDGRGGGAEKRINQSTTTTVIATTGVTGTAIRSIAEAAAAAEILAVSAATATSAKKVERAISSNGDNERSGQRGGREQQQQQQRTNVIFNNSLGRTISTDAHDSDSDRDVDLTYADFNEDDEGHGSIFAAPGGGGGGGNRKDAIDPQDIKLWDRTRGHHQPNNHQHYNNQQHIHHFQGVRRREGNKIARRRDGGLESFVPYYIIKRDNEDDRQQLEGESGCEILPGDGGDRDGDDGSGAGDGEQHDGKKGVIWCKGKAIYYCGIIDILQQYNGMKHTETFLLAPIRGGKEKISCVDPHSYAKRFVKYFETHTD